MLSPSDQPVNRESRSASRARGYLGAESTGRDLGSLEQECVDILEEIEATRGGYSKVWRNVQPCVERSARASLGAVSVHNARLRDAEEKLTDLISAVSVLAKERRDYEQRYRKDYNATADALAALAEETGVLRSGLCAVESSRDRDGEMPSAVSELFSALKLQEKRLAQMQKRVMELEAASEAASQGDRHSAMAEGMRQLAAEVSQLRQQGASSCQLLTTTAHASLPRPNACSFEPPPQMGLLVGEASRWVWSARGFTRVGVDGRPIPWAERRHRNRISGIWELVEPEADDPAARSHCGADGARPAREERGFSWRAKSPHAIVVHAGGIYRLVVGVFHDEAASSSKLSVPAVTVHVDGQPIVSFTVPPQPARASGSAPSVSCVAVRGRSSVGAKADRATEACARHSPGPTSPLVRCANSCAARTCCCCRARALLSYTLSEYVVLPCHATLTVVYDANPLFSHQALLELELVA